MLSVVSISNISSLTYNQFPNIVGILISSISLIAIKKTGKFELISILTVLSVLVLISLVYLRIKNTAHYTTPLWMILNILITFFVLGKKWGAFILSAHFIVLFFYYWFFFKSNLDNLIELTQMDIINYIIETFILAFAIFYILRQFIESTSYAEIKILNYPLHSLNVNTLRCPIISLMKMRVYVQRNQYL